jgi:hypothetical protein
MGALCSVMEDDNVDSVGSRTSSGGAQSRTSSGGRQTDSSARGAPLWKHLTESDFVHYVRAQAEVTCTHTHTHCDRVP